MDLSIVAIRYLEPEYQETVKCIEATGLPVTYIDRNPAGIGSLAEAINRGVKEAKTRYVWVVTNITFEPKVFFELLYCISTYQADAVHPQFDSDHAHIRTGSGIQEVPFIEFTAAMIDREKWIGLDEACPYWGHDLIHGYEVHKRGGKILVDHTVRVEHTYNRNLKPHPVTLKRKAARKAADPATRRYLEQKYGREWRGIIFPKNEKDIVNFYRNVGKEMNKGSVICCDLDGVLTDGKVWVSHNGELIKGFHTRDLTAIKQLIANGYEFHIITASSWSGAYEYLKKSGAVLHTIRNKEEIPFKFDYAIGDSAWDIPMFRKAKHIFCPADAALEVKTLDGMNVMETKGGEGVILELARTLCETKHGWKTC